MSTCADEDIRTRELEIEGHRDELSRCESLITNINEAWKDSEISLASAREGTRTEIEKLTDELMNHRGWTMETKQMRMRRNDEEEGGS